MVRVHAGPLKLNVRPGGEIGRHVRLKIECEMREGSSPSSGTYIRVAEARSFMIRWRDAKVHMPENASSCWFKSNLLYLFFDI